MSAGLSVFKQTNNWDCGPTCLRIIFDHYEKTVAQEVLNGLCRPDEHGVSLKNLEVIALHFGFEARCLKLDFSLLSEAVELPCVVLWKSCHYVVVETIERDKVTVIDPFKGRLTYGPDEFLVNWTGASGPVDGYVLEVC